VAGLAMMRPLRERDFALLWLGMTISLIGDGIYFVAIAWLVYDLTDSPTALSLVGLAWSVGMVLFLLVGGVASDRFDRRRVMLAADAVRMVAMAVLGALAVWGDIQLWQIVLLSLVYGSAEAFFGPSFSGLVPQLVPGEHLVQANALQEVVRPIAYRLAGPALGGLLVAAFSAGTALLVDAATFVVSITCLALMRARPALALPDRASVREEILEGLAFVRAHAWLWATLVTAAISLLCFWGPVEVLLPYVIRHELDRPASDFGLVLAAGGAGGILGGLFMSWRGLPRQKLRFMYLAWGIAPLAISGYALATATWHLALLAGLLGAGLSLGTVVWATLMQTRVPPDRLGRVTSLDWLVSIGLTPVSFALTAPVAALAGTDATLIGAGVLSFAAPLALYAFVGDLRRDEELHQGGDVLGEPGVGDVGGLHADDLDPLARS
jgi:DHA3 family tetracycline resistance protein-like MFS transporter